MPRLLGVEIPPNKRIEASLPYIYGIGPTVARRVLAEASIDPNTRAKDLSPEQISLIVQIIGNTGILIEGDLRRTPKTKKEYVAWGSESDDGSRSSRFVKPLEPDVKPFKEE